MALLCTGLAMVLPMQSLEPFLLMLSSVFVPLYGVILGRLSWGGIAAGAKVSDRKVDLVAAALWLAGIVLYHALAKWSPQWGSALPTLVFTFALAWLTRTRSR